MAISDQVEYSIKEAQDSLRNALAFAARSERPMVCKAIADTIASLENVVSVREVSLFHHSHKCLKKLKIAKGRPKIEPKLTFVRHSGSSDAPGVLKVVPVPRWRAVNVGKCW